MLRSKALYVACNQIFALGKTNISKHWKGT